MGAWLLGLVALVASPAFATATLPPPATSAAAILERATVDGLAVTLAGDVDSAGSPALSSLPDSGFSLRPAPLSDYRQLFERGERFVEPLPSFDVEPLRLPETRVRAFALFDTPARLPSNRVSDGNATGSGLCLADSCSGAIASWLSEDPAGTVDSPSLYAFVGHQPNMGLDPLGLGEIFAEPVGGAYQAVAAEALDNRNTGGERVAATGLALATMPAAGLEGLFNTLVDTPIRMWRTSPVAARETLATFKAKDADSRIRHGAAAWGAWGQLFLDATMVEGLAERLLLRSAEKKALQAGAAELDAAGGNGGVGTQPPAPVASHPPGVVPLLPNEGAVGTYDDLIAAGSKGDNLTPHHIPSANHMAQHGVSSGDALAINMESPVPGSGGRHRLTFTYGTQADAAMTPRDALAAGVRDARVIYRDQGLYNDYMRRQLQELIRLQKEGRPDLFVEPVASHVVKPPG